jgi:FkbM family methyltransferase
MLHLTPKSETKSETKSKTKFETKSETKFEPERKKTLCFDIGANSGQFTEENHNNFDKIISLEPVNETFNLLQNNVKKYPHIVPLNYAVCNNNCLDVIFYNCLGASGVSSLNKEWLANPKSRFHYLYPTQVEIRCKSITIDKLIELYGMPDLIKIDVEGSEYECITSLSVKTDLICFEWGAEFSEVSIKCLNYLQKLGYTKSYIQNLDDYNFRPTDEQLNNSIEDTKIEIVKKIHKQDWGMIWCK